VVRAPLDYAGAIVLSNRHHYRDSAYLQRAFGCPAYCNRAGLHQFTDAIASLRSIPAIRSRAQSSPTR
jgi:hypothetical protein